MHLLRTAFVALALLGTPAIALAEANAGSAAPAPAPSAAPTGSAEAPPAASSAAGQTQEVRTESGQQAAKGGDPFGGGLMLLMMAIPLVLLLVFSSRSQKKEERRLQSMRGGLKRGDQVVTIGGVHGEVAAVGEATVDLRVGKGDDGAVMTFNKSAIATVATGDAKGK